ncbi:MAG: hypothetical protein KDJ20_19345 [Hyphomicrobiales bacterium]|nr:hypothetical protein [Rhodoblastus sp.]MCB9997404.1 hypothetical protein [Methylobacteriaceae bacterium]MCC2101764.1 hypothetical protein [Hyphomicrobiales bacterium]HRY03529.1 hypothetical protein [Beijerinckiaceae bacterium]MCC2106023.1 hypothetical protein [Hyphomicrobiales bacterium]
MYELRGLIVRVFCYHECQESFFRLFPGRLMNSSPNRLLLLGLIQDLHRQAVELGLSRTAAALEVTGHVATEELADAVAPSSGQRPVPLPGEEGAD